MREIKFRAWVRRLDKQKLISLACKIANGKRRLTMSNKIIRLESLSLMDNDENPDDGSVFQTTRIIEVGHPYDEPHFKIVWEGSYRKSVECHSDRDVVSIEFIRSLCDSDGYCYSVRLKDGNELSLPIHAFIAETKEVTDDDE